MAPIGDAFHVGCVGSMACEAHLRLFAAIVIELAQLAREPFAGSAFFPLFALQQIAPAPGVYTLTIR